MLNDYKLHLVKKAFHNGDLFNANKRFSHFFYAHSYNFRLLDLIEVVNVRPDGKLIYYDEIVIN